MIIISGNSFARGWDELMEKSAVKRCHYINRFQAERPKNSKKSCEKQLSTDRRSGRACSETRHEEEMIMLGFNPTYHWAAPNEGLSVI
jgi:hypothetical protein